MLHKMIQTHGVKNGLRRFYEEITENRLFDLVHGVETSKIITHAEFYNLINQEESQGAVWYQPTYATPLIKAFQFLQLHHLDSQKKVLFIDLGVGKGKPTIIANKYLRNVKIIGVDLSADLLAICKKNLESCKADFELIESDVLHVNFAKLFESYDQVVIHNKNSFDNRITGEVLNNILRDKGDTKVFYVYNNPVYQELFEGKERIFERDGWHKNQRLHIYAL